MEANKLTPDQFSKFIAGLILKCESYSFDAFYDIHNIMQRYKSGMNNHDDKNIEVLHLMCRNTGFDLVSTDDEIYSTYYNHNDTVYQLTFCWNYKYFYDEVFCICEKIK